MESGESRKHVFTKVQEARADGITRSVVQTERNLAVMVVQASPVHQTEAPAQGYHHTLNTSPYDCISGSQINTCTHCIQKIITFASVDNKSSVIIPTIIISFLLTGQ